MADDATFIAESIGVLRVTRAGSASIERPLYAWSLELTVGRPGTRCAIVVDEPLLAGMALNLGWDGQRLVARAEGRPGARSIEPGNPLRIGGTAIALELAERATAPVLPPRQTRRKAVAKPQSEPRVYRPPRNLASNQDDTIRAPLGDALRPSVDLLGRLTLRTLWGSLVSMRGKRLALVIGVLTILSGSEAGYLLWRPHVELPALASLPANPPPPIVIPNLDRFAKRSTDTVLKAALDAVEAGRTSDAVDAFETLALLQNDEGARFMVWLLTHPEVRQRR